MHDLAADRSEAVFEDFKAAFTRNQALAEANRCLFCSDAPCIQACPTHIDIPQFIRKIATDNVKGSARTIFDSNILGMSCARVCPVETLCAGACVYNHRGEEPIAIGKLQRYATDIAFEKGWRFFEAGKDSGKSVGLIGAGPASLACAHELRRKGHKVTIVEKRPVIGGLNTTGVAPYKMKSDRALDEVKWVLGIGGIEVKTGVEVTDFAAFRKQYDAVFVGIGLGADSKLGIPGEERTHGAVDYIEQLKLSRVAIDKTKPAVVVGGGNTALDAVRELRGLGVEHVTLVYRGIEPAMSGYQHEWDAAKVEGVRALWQTQPVAYEGNALKCVKLDSAKKPIAGSEHTVSADLVLVAIGQAKLKLPAQEPGVFMGGDCANGGKEVVNAAAEGKAAALAIHTYLGGK